MTFLAENTADDARREALESAIPEPENACEASYETIRFCATREVVEAHVRHLQSGVYKMLLAFLVIAQLFWLVPLALGSDPNYFVAISVSALMAVLYVILHTSAKKQVDAILQKSRGDSEYRIFDGYLEYRDYDASGEVTTFYRVERSEVEMPTLLPTLLVFRKSGISFCIPRELITPESTLWTIVYPDGIPSEPRALNVGKLQMRLPRTRAPYERVLTWLSAVSALFAVCLFERLGGAWWICFVLLLLPIGLLGLVLYGIVKGERVRALPVVCVLLCGFILFVSGFAALFRHGMQKDWETVEPYFAMAEVAVPEYTETWTEERRILDRANNRYVEVYRVGAYLDEESADDFCEAVTADTRWVQQQDAAVIEAFGEILDEYSDLSLLYNITEGTYNQDALSDEECEYVLFCFSGSYPTIDIIIFTK